MPVDTYDLKLAYSASVLSQKHSQFINRALTVQ